MKLTQVGLSSELVRIEVSVVGDNQVRLMFVQAGGAGQTVILSLAEAEELNRVLGWWLASPENSRVDIVKPG